MKKSLLLLVTVVIASFGATVSTASADPDIMCTLEKKGIYHSPIGSACHEPPWGP